MRKGTGSATRGIHRSLAPNKQQEAGKTTFCLALQTPLETGEILRDDTRARVSQQILIRAPRFKHRPLFVVKSGANFVSKRA